ncbi:hypothetical protein [Peterkaempfera griseoplana]|nr:hypothetical protein [Peterkaempfera griseoplana]
MLMDLVVSVLDHPWLWTAGALAVAGVLVGFAVWPSKEVDDDE